jgi:TRAP-type mannitol/chloroaromatic compound transport system permease small subunit
VDTTVRPGAEGWLDRLILAMNTLGSVWVLAMVLLVNADALLRTFLNRPLAGVHEIVELSLVAIVCLQLPDAIRIGRMTRSDGVLNLLDARRPAVGRFLRGVFDLLAAAFMVFVLIGAWRTFVDSYRKGEFAGTVGLFTAPEWPIKLLVVVGASVALVKLSLTAYAWFSGARRIPARSAHGRS